MAGHALLGVLGLAAWATPAGSRGFRGELELTARHVGYRAVERDSLAESEVPGDGTTRRLPDGTLVTCIPGGDCFWYRAGELATAHPMTQDLRLTGWPGWQGVSARGWIRGRLGGDDFWPESSQRLSVMELSVDFQRARWRLRGGRQTTSNGIGQYGFDGGLAIWEPAGGMTLGAYAGRSLAHTLHQTITGSLLTEADEIPPDRAALLLGVEARLRSRNALSGALAYQRELRTDRRGLYSERAALDGRWSGRRTTADLSLSFDVATLDFNRARLHVDHVLTPLMTVGLEARHFTPFFELWTIWGAFAPVGYNELRGTAVWRSSGDLAVDASAAYRNYEETHVGGPAAPIDGDGTRLQLGAAWARHAWTVTARGGMNRGYGAYRGTLDLSLGRRLNDRTTILLFGLGTQQFTEFRFGDGRSVGAGVQARYATARWEVSGDGAVYRHAFENRPGYPDYSQIRGGLRFLGRFGSEPRARSGASAGGDAR